MDYTLHEWVRMASHHGSIARCAIEKQAEESGLDALAVREKMRHHLRVMQEAAQQGLDERLRSVTGLTGGQAALMMKRLQAGKCLAGNLLGKAEVYALATAECNGCMGKIVAAPTAGACGILPGAVLAMMEEKGATEEQAVDALFVAAAVGQAIATQASISGAEGGCQAECGSAAAMAAAALVLALVFALQLSMSIADPIRRLTQTMRRVEEGDLHVRCQVSSRTELGQLSDSFNHMIAKTADLMDERLRIEEQKRKSEWKALQAQIQPHFLYNTLDSIIWMSHAGRNEEVVEMTSALALLLRSSIGDGSDTNTLKKEIAHVRSYLTIQKMRYHTLHDEIDNVEKELHDRLGCEAVIHMDPIVTNDEAVNVTHQRIAALVRGIDENISIHDFRMVTGPTHTNVIFDAVVPYGCKMSDREAEEKIKKAVHELDPSYFAVVQIDKSYVR